MQLTFVRRRVRLAQPVPAAYKGAAGTGQRLGQDEDRMPPEADSSVIAEEVARFDALGDAWWDADGPMAPLHRLTPVRVGWARDLIARHFKRDALAGAPLAGLDLLDIGCGAGLFAEPLARLGADVIGVDPAPATIEVARRHAEETGAKLTYRLGAAEELEAEPRRFDVVSAMEVIEHVADPARFVAAAASLIKPGGLFLASTINRTLKSFAFAILGAEYVLRWLEPGTHRWEQFLKPEELTAAARAAGLKRVEARGCVYDPLGARWRLSPDVSVNYLFAARKRETGS
jgi:2-polyprenyl-6-hydroxyphenyl methylase / 3-demethylubiquinone-9 3-methyltransferase